ncbi:hypothetical protein H6F75_23660 [Nodosilinea sp. FACHB-131]|uniref:hypothetical protein n=1 Tax=Cyanophyceae TaxID=3028117 RepID=UPI00168977B2|nr:hypothetical protein [Nodosilinea sp. FACHB-131]MBD1876489.1 hypothetical protein [Nodosilinea sp. FACHB-131]
MQDQGQEASLEKLDKEGDEFLSKSNNSARVSILHNSPLLVAVFGGWITLLGGVFTVALQANAQLELERQKAEAGIQLERQKIEFSLIQKALSNPSREEAAKELIFLVDTGIIQSLDASRIRERAENPESLPYGQDMSSLLEEAMKSLEDSIEELPQ